MYSKDRIISVLNRISFERFGGTKNEFDAAKLIQEELSLISLSSKLEKFDVQMSDIKEAKLEITSPFELVIPCTAYMCCASTPKEGLEGEFYYYEQANEVHIKQAKNKICLVNGYVGMALYKEFAKAGAKAIISFNGNANFPDAYDLDKREMRKTLAEINHIPAVNILVSDAIKLVDGNVEKVKITVLQDSYKSKSQNVVCEIKGHEKDIIVLTAHYDSVFYSNGAYDNATGSVALLALAEYFSKNKPQHTLRFIWCGSEERGLLGSKAYVNKHNKNLDKIKFCINVDMIGSILGKRIAVCTADMSLVHYIEYLGKCIGFPICVSQGVYSSDSTPFADAGIPSVSFARIAPDGFGEIHNRYDTIEILSNKYLFEDIEFILEFVRTMSNAFVIPVPREIPQNIKDEIDKYYCRNK